MTDIFKINFMDQDRIKIAEFCGITFTEIKNGNYIGYRTDPFFLETIPNYTGSRDDFFLALRDLSEKQKGVFMQNLWNVINPRPLTGMAFICNAILACDAKLMSKVFVNTFMPALAFVKLSIEDIPLGSSVRNLSIWKEIEAIVIEKDKEGIRVGKGLFLSYHELFAYDWEIFKNGIWQKCSKANV